MELAFFKVYLVPPQGDRFTDAQPMPVHQQQQRVVALTVPTQLSSSLQQLLDFIG
jgi:hypothetical protein